MADRPDILVLPPLAFVAALGAALLLEVLVPWEVFTGGAPVWMRVFGAALVIGATALGLAGIWAFKTSGTHVHPHHPALVVVETGPYRFTRNPMYLGMIQLLIGLGLAFSSGWMIVVAPVFGLVLHFGVVLREEAYLKAKFGAPYQNFTSRTRRWL